MRRTSRQIEAFGAELCVIGAGPVGLVTALELAAARAAGAGAGERRAAGRGRRRRRCRRRKTCGPRATTTRRSPWRAGSAAPRTSGAGAACRSIPIDFAPGPGSAAAGLADRAGGSRALAGAGLRRARRRRAGVARAAARGGGRRRLRLREPRALEQRAAHPGAAPPRHSPSGRTSWWRSGRRRSASPTTAGRIAAVEAHLEGRGRGRVAVSQVVLAAGGNESTRLLLAEQRRQPGLFGGPDGPLGRFYMGHVVGRIADIAFESQALHDGLDFHVARRRLRAAPAGAGPGDPGGGSGSPTSPSGRWCPRSPTRRTAPGRSRRSSWRSRSRRSGGGWWPRRSGGGMSARRRSGAARTCATCSPTCRRRSASCRGSSGTTGWRGCGCRASSSRTRPAATGSSIMPSSCRAPTAG